MVAFISRMPAGIPGTISRAAEQSTVEPVPITPAGQANAPTSYGVGTVIDANTGQLRLPAAGDAAITGILTRPFPTTSSQDPLGTSTVPAKGPVDRCKRGYVSVLLSGATQPVKDGAVYCRIQNAAAGKFVGGFEAAADGGNTVAVANAYFTGPPDANGNVEVAFNI
jgi:hypothetical protein